VRGRTKERGKTKVKENSTGIMSAIGFFQRREREKTLSSKLFRRFVEGRRIEVRRDTGGTVLQLRSSFPQQFAGEEDSVFFVSVVPNALQTGAKKN